DGVLDPVHEQDRPPKPEQPVSIPLRVPREVVLERAQEGKVGRPPFDGGADRELVVHEEADLLGIGRDEAPLERGGADPPGDDPPVPPELGNGMAPRLGEATQAVEQDGDRSLPFREVVEKKPVQLAALEPDLRHGQASSSRVSESRNGKTLKIPPVWMKQTRWPSDLGSRSSVWTSPPKALAV